MGNSSNTNDDSIFTPKRNDPDNVAHFGKCSEEDFMINDESFSIPRRGLPKRGVDANSLDIVNIDSSIPKRAMSS